jgi:hypothetical protein
MCRFHKQKHRIDGKPAGCTKMQDSLSKQSLPTKQKSNEAIVPT